MYTHDKYLVFSFRPTGKNHATRLFLSHLGFLSPENLQVKISPLLKKFAYFELFYVQIAFDLQ